MRYTTIIDLREWPALYRNANIRLVYLHCCLIAGYHDHDRDLASTSLSRIATDCGLTIAAARHAVDTLIKYKLLARVGSIYQVTKWVPEQAITSRPRTERQQQAIERQAQRRQEIEARQRERDIEEQRRLQLRSQGKTPFMLYYEQLQAKAAAGDPEAAALVKKHAAAYQLQKDEISKDKKRP